MNKRQETILAQIIREYERKAIPIASQLLAEIFDFDLSSATLRNEMLSLEKEGYLTKPHTSAGRIPTAMAYRYYVEELMEETNLTRAETKLIHNTLSNGGNLLKKSAELLSSLSHELGVSGFWEKDENFHFEEFYQKGLKDILKEPEFGDKGFSSRAIEIFDELDKTFEKFFNPFLPEKEVKVYVGKNRKMKKMEGMSTLVSTYKLGGDRKGILAIMGPERMNYARNVSLLKGIGKELKNFI